MTLAVDEESPDVHVQSTGSQTWWTTQQIVAYHVAILRCQSNTLDTFPAIRKSRGTSLHWIDAAQMSFEAAQKFTSIMQTLQSVEKLVSRKNHKKLDKRHRIYQINVITP